MILKNVSTLSLLLVGLIATADIISIAAVAAEEETSTVGGMRGYSVVVSQIELSSDLLSTMRTFDVGDESFCDDLLPLLKRLANN